MLLPWVGADNTNHFFTPEDLFNTNETAAFGSDLLNAGASYFGGTTTSTYDRYTFYRMLAQLGTDTAPESGKMNLNYDNLDSGSNGCWLPSAARPARRILCLGAAGIFQQRRRPAAEGLHRAMGGQLFHQ